MTSTPAYSLPEPSVWLFRLLFWGVLCLLVTGSIGIYRASKEEFALHRNTKDVFLSILVTLLNWLPLGLLLWIARQDGDLIRSMKSEIAQLATVWVGSFAMAIVQARKCNPGISAGQAFFAGCGRLLLGTLAQLCSLLVVFGSIFIILSRGWGNRTCHFIRSSVFDLSARLFLISLLASLFEFIWITIYETDREEVRENMGWVYWCTNVLVFALTCWGVYALDTHYGSATHEDLVRAAEKSRPATVRRIVAFNPELSREEALNLAVDKGHKGTLKALIRNRKDYSTAHQRATATDNDKMLLFLKK